MRGSDNLNDWFRIFHSQSLSINHVVHWPPKLPILSAYLFHRRRNFFIEHTKNHPTPRHCTLTLTPSPSSTVSYSITVSTSLLYTTMLRTSITRALRPIRQTPALTRFYHEKVIDHYERPRNVGSLPKNDIDVGTGLYFPCPPCLFDS